MKKQENKKPVIGVTAINKLLKGSKTEDKEVTIKNEVTGAELQVIIKTDADFTDVISIAASIIEKMKTLKIRINTLSQKNAEDAVRGANISKAKSGSSLDIDVSLDDFIKDMTFVSEFTNINVDNLKADVLWDLITRTNLMSEIMKNVNPCAQRWIDKIVCNTLEKEAKADTWRNLGAKLNALADTVSKGIGDVDTQEALSLAQKFANLDEDKIVEAVLNHGTDGAGRDESPAEVGKNS